MELFKTGDRTVTEMSLPKTLFLVDLGNKLNRRACPKYVTEE